MKIWAWVLAAAVGMTALSDASAAKRLGGGQSVGKQSSNVTKREAPAQQAPAQNAATPAPAQNAAAPAQNAAPAAAAKPAAAANPAAQPAKKPWGAMLGGLAAGLGLAWLAHSLGFGEAFAQVLLFGLLALAVMVAIGWFMRRRQTAGAAAASTGSPYAFAGAGAEGGTVAMPRSSYRPENVGNDASARPFERHSIHAELEPATTGARPGGIVIGSALGNAGGSGRWVVPEGFDTPGFLAAAKANFVSLQAAWDRADIPSLRAMMTDEMLVEIQVQLRDRDQHTGGHTNQTDVVMLEAQLLGIEDLGDDYMASVEFSGMIREDPASGPSPFREVWNMTKPKNGASGWLVAGVQALQ